MSRLKYFTYGTLLVLLLSAVTCRSAAVEGDSIVKKNECIKSYNITRGTSPWQGLTSSYEDEEASKKIAAMALKGSDYKPIPSLAGYELEGMILMGRCEKRGRVAVEGSFFSGLIRADATRKTSGRMLIGTCKTSLLKNFTSARIAEFLIESQIVNTYWHVESVFCLDSEDDSADTYTAHYIGKHIYFTNSKNEDPLDFSIVIDKKTGEMFLDVK